MADGGSSRWHSAPDDYFFVVGRDQGLSCERNPGWILRPVTGARVRQFACSDYPEVQQVIERNLEKRWAEVTPTIFEINTVPVIAANAVMRGGACEIDGKCLMNGAAGDRLYARYLKHNPGMRSYRASNRFFMNTRENTTLALPEQRALPERPDIAIECRNRRNFYHFVTEALPQLVHFAERKPKRITFHCRKNDTSEFSTSFIDALFPDLAGRIEFTDKKRNCRDIVLPLNFRHMIYSSGDPRVTVPLSSTGADTDWQDMSAHVRRRKFAFKNSYDVSLRLLREHALSLIDPVRQTSMPKKIWISRDNTAAGVNSREMVGEHRLVEELKRQGFEQMFFEHMTPLEQISAINAADTIGSFHGAVFAHMMFARPDAHVVEVGSVQTQMHRWGDFLGNAHVSGCRYSMVFADTASDRPDEIQPIAEGLIGVRVGSRAIDLIAKLAAEGQPA